MHRHSPLRKTAGTILFAAALALASSSASALCFISTPAPTSTVTNVGASSYAYGYTVSGSEGSCVSFYGTSPYVTDLFEVPYFTDAGITDIHAPAGWTASIVATDTFGLGSGAETLVWTATAGSGIDPSTGLTPPPTLSGFGYTADFSSVYSPAGVQLTAWLGPTFVDPALPASPSALAAGLQLATFPTLSAVPEPSSMLAMLAGLGCLAIARRRRG